MEDQTGHISKKVESENIVNVDAIKQEIELDRIGNEEGEINPYHERITNKVEKDNTVISQMEEWTILSNVVNYVQCDRHPENFYDLDIKALHQKSHKKIWGKEEERQILELDFGDTPEKLRGEYLDMYERIQSEVISTTRFDENSVGNGQFVSVLFIIPIVIDLWS